MLADRKRWHEQQIRGQVRQMCANAWFSGLLICILFASSVLARAQGADASAPAAADLQQKIEAISVALNATERQIEQSQREMQQLQLQLQDLKRQMSAVGAGAGIHSATSTGEAASASLDTSRNLPASAGDGQIATAPEATSEERQQATDAEVKVLDQIKVESGSKYPVRVTGLVLFNAFLNHGVPDNVDLPEVALRATSTSGNGSAGASLRQTVLGIEGDGPHIFGARTSANVSIDFFDGVAYTNYGTSAGVVRMKTASLNFDWQNDLIEAGLTSPLISPLSPTSFATVAEPALSGAGNLWTWAPQLRYAHRFPVHDSDRVQFEFGLWDPPSSGYNPNQLFRIASAGELAERPAYETRISYSSRDGGGSQIGVGGYYSRQSYPGYAGTTYTEHLDAWASTFDFRLPFARHFEITGEGYRGRAIAGLGGGVYKDLIQGTSPLSGLAVLHGLNAIGGWAQWKTRFNEKLEANLAMGLDDGFARDFHAVVLPANASAGQLRARNQMFVANIIYRPKTYIILSPEYRRIWSWPANSSVYTLDLFTMSFGFQF